MFTATRTLLLVIGICLLSGVSSKKCLDFKIQNDTEYIIKMTEALKCANIDTIIAQTMEVLTYYMIRDTPRWNKCWKKNKFCISNLILF